MRNVLLTLIAVAALATLAPAPARAAGRLFKAFDFEERLLGNDEDVPMHWLKLAGHDLPHYVVGRLTTDRARSGRYSFCMDLNGGNCVYQYEPNLMPARLGGHYRLTGFCQATAMAYARARLTLAAADAGGLPIPGAEAHSDLYAGPTATAAADADPAAWQPLSAELTVDDPQAVYLLVRMELLQPARYAPPAKGSRQIVTEDVRGSAWFDDLVVAQTPRLSLSTARPGNVFRRGDEPALAVLLADPSTDDLTAQLAVTDADGRQVYQRTGTLSPTTAQAAGAGRYRVALPLPIVPAGWYRATLRTASPGADATGAPLAALTGSQSLDFVQLPDGGAIAPPDARFGLDATALPVTAWPALPDVLPMLSAGRARLPAWGPTGDVGTPDGSRPFDAMVDRLAGLGIAPVGCLLSPPPAVAASWTALAAGGAGGDDAWRPSWSAVIGRHASQIRSWQVGADGADAFATDPSLRRLAARMSAAAAGLTASFDLAIPCPVGVDAPAGKGPSAVSLALSVPATVLPSEITPYLRDALDRAAAAGPRVASASLRPLDAARYGPAARAADLAQRVVYALATGVARVDLPVPLTPAESPLADPERATVEPTDLFPVERTLLTALAGTACYGRVPLADGVEAFLFDRPDAAPGDHGLIVAWADAADPAADRAITIHLGDHLARTDLAGNTVALAAASPVRVGPTPVVLSGVDVPLARFRAGLTIDRPTLESVRLQPQVRRVHLSNPYPQPIAGTVRLRAPAGWTLSPSIVSFTLNPGEALDRDVAIDLPVNCRAGRNLVTADVELQSDALVRLAVPLPITVGLADLGVQSTAFRDGDAIVVQQRITNYGTTPVDYVAYVTCPNHPREERLVTALAPGRTTLKRYRFPFTSSDVAHLRAGVRDADGTHVLNEALTVP